MRMTRDVRRTWVDRLWAVLPRALESGVRVILVLAAGTEVVTAAVGGASPLQYSPVLLMVAGFALGHRIPYAGLALVAAAAPVAVIVGREPVTAIWSMACFSVFVLALRGLSALVGGVVVAATNFAAVAASVGTVDVNVDASASIAAFAAVVCAAIGSSIRGNHRYRVEAEQRVRDAEASRVTAVERGVARERLRIARDLHDSVGHQIAVVSMHLGAAEVHLPAGAEQSRDDLTAARDGVRAVLRETQQILTVLRLEDADRPLEPTPGLAALPDLVESFRRAGMRIETRMLDAGGRLSAPAGAAVYRIVQESLTNALKHGSGTVSLAVREDGSGDVSLEVANLPRIDGPAAPGGGNGIVGMRERAESVGGTLSVRTGRGLFWVIATIPAEKEAR